MRTLLALLLLSASAHAQCCPGGCPPQMYQQPRYSQPRQQGPSPDGDETPEVGSPGTPQFQPLPPPPVTTTPPLPPQKPQPQFDWDAYDKQQKEILEAQHKNNAELHSLVVALNGQKAPDNSQLEAKLDAILSALSTKPAAEPQAAKPFYLRVNPTAPYVPVSPGQYVTLPLDKSQQK